MGIFSNNLLAGAGGQAGGGTTAFYDYQIEQSCRFSYDESTHMTRTPSSTGNRRTFTFSTWIKRSNQDDNDAFFGTYSGSGEFAIKFNGGSSHLDKLGAYNYTPGGSGTFQFEKKVDSQFRDLSGWYHVVIRIDTTSSTASERVRFYVNGTERTNYTGTVLNPSQNFDTYANLSGQANYIGWYGASATNRFDGYMAETILVDGYSYDASYFGETKNGVWVPKDYHTVTGNYGTNGFLLKYENASDLGNDSSGNNNDFSTNNIGADHQVLDSPTFGS